MLEFVKETEDMRARRIGRDILKQYKDKASTFTFMGVRLETYTKEELMWMMAFTWESAQNYHGSWTKGT